MVKATGSNELSEHVPLIISTLVVVLTVAGGFWSLADPRAELKNIRDNYLTIREHAEFTNRVSRDIVRLETIEDELQRSKADKEDLTVLAKSVQAQIDLLRKDQLTESEFGQYKSESDARIKHMEEAIDRLTDKMDHHQERDTDRFNGRSQNGR